MATRREQWEEAFKASKIREADYSSMSGIPYQPVYGPADGEHPGQYPYTRGVHASMYRSKLWTMRMFAGFGTAEDTNWRFKEILRAGGDGLSTAFDMPTLLGIDSDDPMAPTTSVMLAGAGAQVGIEASVMALDFGSMPFPVLEGQSIGIIAPGVDERGKPHHAAASESMPIPPTASQARYTDSRVIPPAGRGRRRCTRRCG